MTTTVKDPVMRFDGERWEAWLCIHPLDVPNDDDRMFTAYATNTDGLAWSEPVGVLRVEPET